MRALLLLTLALLAGCSSQPTEVMLVVDGEFATPSQVDGVTIEVRSPDGTVKSVVASLDEVSGFPQTLGVVKGAGPDGEYLVTVTARHGSTVVVVRRASFRFTASEIRMVRLDLLLVCQSVSCPSADRTCTEGGLCSRVDVSTDPWIGPPSSRFDAGASVGPIVVP